jgi:uncharacterized integral membrane protein
MTRLIASVVVLAALAILIILNVNYQSPINLFGAQLSNVSVVVIALAGFILGIVYSAVLHIISRICRRQRASLKKTGKNLTAKATELAEWEKSVAADKEAGAAGTAASDSDPETTMSASRMESEGGISEAPRS